MSNLVNKIVPS